MGEWNAGAKHQQDSLQTDLGVCRTIAAGTHGSAPHLLKTLITPICLTGMAGGKHTPNAEPIDVAGTLCARDYKGPNNFGFNGVIECQKKSQ